MAYSPAVLAQIIAICEDIEATQAEMLARCEEIARSMDRMHSTLAHTHLDCLEVRLRRIGRQLERRDRYQATAAEG